jgi:hypothetical protein
MLQEPGIHVLHTAHMHVACVTQPVQCAVAAPSLAVAVCTAAAAVCC